MDFNTLLNSATRMQKKILFAFAIGVIPAYTALFFTFEKFASYIFPTQIMLSLMLSSSIVIAYLVMVFVTDYFMCNKVFSAKSYEMYSVVYVSFLCVFTLHNDINSVFVAFLCGPFLFAIPRFINEVVFAFRRHRSPLERKKKIDYEENSEYPKEE